MDCCYPAAAGRGFKSLFRSHNKKAFKLRFGGLNFLQENISSIAKQNLPYTFRNKNTMRNIKLSISPPRLKKWSWDMFTIYVLYSSQFDKIYIGYTSDLVQRMNSHNMLATKGWTIKYRPWRLIHYEEYSAKKDAMLREKELKSHKGRDFIRNVIEKV